MSVQLYGDVKLVKKVTSLASKSMIRATNAANLFGHAHRPHLGRPCTAPGHCR